MINKERLVNNFVEMIKIDSETRNEIEMFNYLKAHLSKLGFEVKCDNAGTKFGSNANNLIATKQGEPGIEPIILSAHMDTVTPGIGIEPIIDGDMIHSKGDTILGSDDKAGIAIILEAIQTIIDNNDKHQTIICAFLISEEGGLNGSKHLDYSLLNAKNALIFDSGGPIGTIITSAPGQNSLKITVKGKAAHAGVEPEKGINALEVAAHAITNINLLRVDEETTCNFGIVNGGNATNIVLPELFIHGEVRSINKDKLTKHTEHMISKFEEAAEKFNTTVDIEVEKMYEPYVIESSNPLLQKYFKANEECGFTPSPKPTGGGSDANNFNNNGILALNIGVNMQNVHTVDEKISITDMVDATRVLYTFLKNEVK